MAVFLARIVMPFSRSRSPESMTRSTGSDRSAKAPACRSIASTNVVLPWSTWATMATFRRSVRTFRVVAVRAVGTRKAPWYRECWAPADSYGRLGHTTA